MTRDDVRAVLVTRKQRDDTDVLYSTWGDGMSTAEHAALGEIVEAYDAAAGRRRIPWCVEHDYPAQWPAMRGCMHSGVRDEDGEWHDNGPCRVVDALVVPLPQSGGDMPDCNYVDPFGPPGMMGG